MASYGQCRMEEILVVRTSEPAGESALLSSNLRNVSLDQKWTSNNDVVFLSGTQAIAKVMLIQRALDRRMNLNTAGFVSGYRGSPVGGVDSTLWSISKLLHENQIVFRPGINEDLAATAVRGTQQVNSVPGALVDGVFAAWYGKGPGVDRSGDALKHGNFLGASRDGGVLVFFGDDHAGKSSTVAHQSEQALAASLIPSLYPADVQEILDFGVLGIALSRYSGAWVGIKCLNDVIDTTATVDVDVDRYQFVRPPYPDDLPDGLHAKVGPFNPLANERVVLEHRLPLVQAFVRANNVDRVVFQSERPKIGLIASGRAFGDLRAALDLLGLDERRAAELGLSLFKVGCIWPLEPERIREFATGHDVVLVVEDKKSLIEEQLASLLVNCTQRPVLIGKRDKTGKPLLSSTTPLDPITIAKVVRDVLVDEGVRVTAPLSEQVSTQLPITLGNQRTPFFCSGCPHSRSTKTPDGSYSMTGIGCHGMASLISSTALPATHMGGEGANWIGMAPFTSTPHIFQNMGEGTYYHSGLLAVRAAVASGVNITFKILYNDAVAMTGGQPVDGPISVPEIAQQVLHEGARKIVILSDDPGRHLGNAGIPKGVHIGHRDELDAVQRELREMPGCTVLIYEQTCAAEKRRRRKRGTYPIPEERLLISEAVCEGCGDCGDQSTCVSLLPVETALGRKRQIDQSSCNQDFSCLNGFCPSFISVRSAKQSNSRRPKSELKLPETLEEPKVPALGDATYNIIIAGIGGTGVITIGALLGMAAHLEGKAASVCDMTGLAQKNGAVFSHLRVSDRGERIRTQKLTQGEADLLLAMDAVAASSSEVVRTLSNGHTRTIVNTNVVPTAALQLDRDFQVPAEKIMDTLGAKSVETIALNATSIATSLMGDSIAANLFLVGVAMQRGLLPVSPAAVERAIQLNEVAVRFNLAAFKLGRLFVLDRQAVLDQALTGEAPRRPKSLGEVVEHRVALLTQYQNSVYARGYQALVEQVRTAEQRAVPGSESLTMAAAKTYAKLLAYKDEFEVARLLTGPELNAKIVESFGSDAKIAYNLAPPFFSRKMVNGRPMKRKFPASIRPLLAFLAWAKWLRPTKFNPFGVTAERKMERALISEYEELVGVILSKLSAANLNEASRILSLADQVRGFGPVKEQAALRYRAALMQALKAF